MRFFLIFIIIWLGGCAATGPKFSKVLDAPPKEALIYIYRSNTFVMGARTAYFYIDGVNIFDLKANGYSWVSLPVGEYELKQRWSLSLTSKKDVKIPLKISSNEDYYFRLSTGICPHGYMEVCVAWQLIEVDYETAKDEISVMHYQNNFGNKQLRSKLNLKVLEQQY